MSVSDEVQNVDIYNSGVISLSMDRSFFTITYEYT